MVVLAEEAIDLATASSASPSEGAGDDDGADALADLADLLGDDEA
jgi:hypothetical protein